MKTFFLFLTFFACYKIIMTKSANRALWFLGSLLFLSDNIGILESFNSHFLFVISFFISQIRHKELRPYYKSYPLFKISIFIFIVYLLIGILDQRIPPISRISRPIKEFFLSYTAFYIGFYLVKSHSELRKVLNNLSTMLFIVCIYGIITFVLQNNPWYDLLTSAFGGKEGIWSNVQERGYRVCSFLSNPIVYGGVMGLYSLIFLNAWKPKNKVWKIAVITLLLLSVIIANSRTGMFTTLAAYVTFYLLKNKLSYKNIALALFGIIAIYFVYYNFSFATPIIDSAIDLVVTGGKNTAGSSIDLKEQQWIASLAYFYSAPFFGNGFAYFSEVIGNENSALQNTLLAGMEGYQYKLLIENGIVLIITITIFYIQLCWLFLKNRNSNLAYLGIASTLTFLFFICSTGTYGSTFLHFGTYIGLILRCVYDKKILNPNPCIQRREIHQQVP